MRNIERIAIDSIINQTSEVNEEAIVSLTGLKTRLDEAKKEYLAAANVVVSSYRNNLKDITEELSPEGVQYIETEVSTKVGIPFKLK